jgi:hypothetical protein
MAEEQFETRGREEFRPGRDAALPLREAVKLARSRVVADHEVVLKVLAGMRHIAVDWATESGPTIQIDGATQFDHATAVAFGRIVDQLGDRT